MAWLVYRGEMLSAGVSKLGGLSIWHTGYLRAAVLGSRHERYERELALEAVRAREFPDAVSRLTGFYCFPDADSARRAAYRWSGFPLEKLADIGIHPDSNMSTHDATWITRALPLDEPEWMRDYWAGVATDDPVPELIVEGRAIVLDAQPRQAAYATIERIWPQALAALELARLAVELGSDLGHIAAAKVVDRDGLRVRFIMDFEDATNEDFLQRLAAFDGPKNEKDLSPFAGDSFSVPDLRSEEFWILRPPPLGAQ